MVPTPTQCWLKSCWKMWERPLICKTELRLTEVEPFHSHIPRSTFVQAYSIHANTLHDPPTLVSPTTGHLSRTGGGKTSVKGGLLIVRNCQLTLVSKCQSRLISTESPSNLKHLLKRRVLRETETEEGKGKVEEGEIRNNYSTCLFSQCQRHRCIIQPGWMANARMTRKKGFMKVYCFSEGSPHRRIHLSCVPTCNRNSEGHTVTHPVNNRQMEMTAIFRWV